MLGFANRLASSFGKSTFNIKSSSFSTFTQPLWMRTTMALQALPQKKKKAGDPALVKLKIEKKRKRIWRECRRLMKLEKQLKPLEELDIPYKIVDNRELYTRERKPVPVEKLEEREELLRHWTAYKTKQHAKDLQLIDRIEYTQHRALEELLKESPELYKKAIQIDETFLPFKAMGVTQTPPIQNYFNPDGEYIDVSNKWEPPKLPDKKELKRLGVQFQSSREEFFKKKKEEKGK